MNSTPSSPTKKPHRAAATEDRELFVVDDFVSMPWLQSRPLFPSFGQWFSAAWRHKVLRKPIEPDFLIECGRFVAARHVPKRIQKYFDEIAREVTSLGFTESFHGTVAALGPYSTATLGMSREDGEIHLFAKQVVTRVGRQIQDENYFGFISWLKDNTSLWTISPCRMPSPHADIDRMVLSSDQPNEVLKKHRERILHKKVQAVSPNDFFEHFEEENAKQVRDWAGRGVIRRANPGEITRIRSEIEV